VCSSDLVCDTVCVNSVPVMEQVSRGLIEHRECLMCGVCVTNCPTRAISFSWTKPNKK
jgi:ferredoxin-type protein NapH